MSTSPSLLTAVRAEHSVAIACANGAALGTDGWALIPFGDTRHSGREGRGDVASARVNAGEKERPLIQRFDRAAALAILNDFKAAWGSFKRAVVGLPIFKGHPDASRFEQQYPDKTPRGTIADMEVTDQGLRIRPVLGLAARWRPA
jgi:hypothetical protein